MVFELKHLTTPVVMAIGKETSFPLIFNDSPLTGVNTPGSDENRLKLKIELMDLLSKNDAELLMYWLLKR